MADLSGWGAGTDNPYLGTSNPYLQQMIDAASGDVVRNFNLSARPASNATMVRSGSFGNSGLEEMARNDEKNLQGSLSDIATKLRFGDYTNSRTCTAGKRGSARVSGNSMRVRAGTNRTSTAACLTTPTRRTWATCRPASGSWAR